MRQVVCLSLLVGLCGLGTVSNSCAEEWTTIRGRIVYSEDAPKMPLLEVTRDEDYCGPFGLRNEALVVNPENRGLKNVAVFLPTVFAQKKYTSMCNNRISKRHSLLAQWAGPLFQWYVQPLCSFSQT